MWKAISWEGSVLDRLPPGQARGAEVVTYLKMLATQDPKYGFLIEPLPMASRSTLQPPYSCRNRSVAAAGKVPM